MADFTYDEDLFSDLFKDANGFRPRSHRFYDASPAEKQVIWDGLLEDLEAENIRYEEERKRNVADFEKLVEQNIQMGASDRKTAIQWLVDAEGDDFYDEGYFHYCYGLPYGYVKLAA